MSYLYGLEEIGEINENEILESKWVDDSILIENSRLQNLDLNGDENDSDSKEGQKSVYLPIKKKIYFFLDQNFIFN